MQSSHAPTGTASPPKGHRGAPEQLHLLLGIGLIVTAAALGVTRYVTSGPEPDPATLITYVMAAVSASMAGAALMFLKRQVPERRAGQTAAAFWADHKVAAAANLFWFILDGSAIVASVAYFLEGSPIAAVLVLFCIAAFWMNGPRVFAQD